MRVSMQSGLCLSGYVLVSMLAIASTAARAAQVVCHYTYGGESKQLVAEPVSSPYAVKGVQVGSYFRFRVVFRDKPADIASIKIYTYADRDEGPVLIHQAIFPYPPTGSSASRYGFSGLHIVNEPVRDGELQYWCAMTNLEKPSPAKIPASRQAQ